MNILGIAAYPLNSAACILRDGNIVAAIEEERLSRVKNDGSFPYLAIKECLKIAKISLKDLDSVGFFMDPKELLFKRFIYRSGKIIESPYHSMGYMLYDVYTTLNFIHELKALIKGTKAKLKFVNHHISHAASSFFASPYEEAAILTMDYQGETISTWLGMGREREISNFHKVHFPHSLGTLYAALTYHLGFKVGEDEYKVMGLASFGKPKFKEVFEKIVILEPNGSFRINLEYFNYQVFGRFRGYLSEKLISQIGKRRNPDEPIEERHADIAASLQYVLEKVVLHLADFLHEKSGSDNLCLAGGVALNCTMNGRLIKDSKFKHIFLQPSSHDAGGSLGSALYIYNQINKQKRLPEVESAYLGPEFSLEEIEKELIGNKINFKKAENIAKTTAELLSMGKIVGWFQGKMEFGPRALGNRSILADPTFSDMKDKINQCIKFREEFRPFAPSVLEEKASEYFDIDQKSPFMQFVVKVHDEKKQVIPAVTHVDGTARVQTVSRKTNGLYYSLIEEFQKIKGVPVILNTSFNIRGEPIVCSPKDALRCFYSCGLDYLVMGKYLISK